MISAMTTKPITYASLDRDSALLLSAGNAYDEPGMKSLRPCVTERAQKTWSDERKVASLNEALREMGYQKPPPAPQKEVWA